MTGEYDRDPSCHVMPCHVYKTATIFSAKSRVRVRTVTTGS